MKKKVVDRNKFYVLNTKDQIAAICTDEYIEFPLRPKELPRVFKFFVDHKPVKVRVVSICRSFLVVSVDALGIRNQKLHYYFHPEEEHAAWRQIGE